MSSYNMEPYFLIHDTTGEYWVAKYEEWSQNQQFHVNETELCSFQKYRPKLHKIIFRSAAVPIHRLSKETIPKRTIMS